MDWAFFEVFSRQRAKLGEKMQTALGTSSLEIKKSPGHDNLSHKTEPKLKLSHEQPLSLLSSLAHLKMILLRKRLKSPPLSRELNNKPDRDTDQEL